jgi:hypothetical protein
LLPPQRVGRKRHPVDLLARAQILVALASVVPAPHPPTRRAGPSLSPLAGGG